MQSFKFEHRLPALPRHPTTLSVVVVVPAHNEEGTITDCLESILQAGSVLSLEHFWVVVAADSCDDGTIERARATLSTRGEIVAIQARCAGRARRAGTEAALRHFAHVAPTTLWIANTDADSVVPADWLLPVIEGAIAGYHGIAGTVALAETTEALRTSHEAHYMINSDGSHNHVHGANLAFRADAYEDVGGWRDVPLSEDHCLWDRLRTRGWRLRSLAGAAVTTSARLVGRAEGGFASTLRARYEARLHTSRSSHDPTSSMTVRCQCGGDLGR